ncbi:MAG: hypothetical protein AYK22_02215 [Thermoplasmatales archaeon SG8-52-3]|nr:MAG: hypothetical protein AYK22_02215 [Thermoplasmatales archaeon SG8-52-3]
MTKSTKTILCAIFSSMFILSISAVAEEQVQTIDREDFDPLVDIEVTVEIKKIRCFDKLDKQLNILPYNLAPFPKREYIDEDSDPDFYLKIFINNEEFTSETWGETKYIYSPDFSATLNVPDDQEFVDITIQLWDSNDDGDVLCDIGNEEEDVDVIYSIITGHWTGEDQINDPSGYGRLNGCDDGSIYIRDKDCELWFDIFQNDFDNDKIPYWTEVNVYGTDPEIDNTGEDTDNDSIPIEWEWKWDYDPLVADNHKNIDPEGDSINNYEEYLTSQWYSDPYRKDIFIELDQMEESPQGEKSIFPEGAKELLYTAYDRQNIVYHLDDGKWEDTGSEMLPFDDDTTWWDTNGIYQQYFLHGNPNNWRRGVFHYGILIYHFDGPPGITFRANSFMVASQGLEAKADNRFFERDEVYASCYMHETGHTLDFWPIPGHSSFGSSPFRLGWWLNRPYKSCMNYGYMYYTVDYSDGSRPIRDYNDWTRMDLSYFEREWG